MNEENYYQILEVDINASNEIIDKAYRTLVKKYHPDLHNDYEKDLAEEKIKKINTAYSILSDTEKRKAYDGKLKNNLISKEQYDILLYENLQLKEKLNNLNNKLSNIVDYYNDFKKNTKIYNNLNNTTKNIDNHSTIDNLNYTNTNFIKKNYIKNTQNSYSKNDKWYKNKTLKMIIKLSFSLILIYIIIQILFYTNIINSDIKILILIVLMIVFFSSIK